MMKAELQKWEKIRKFVWIQLNNAYNRRAKKALRVLLVNCDKEINRLHKLEIYNEGKKDEKSKNSNNYINYNCHTMDV